MTGHHLDGTSAVARFVHRLIEPHEIPIGASTNPKRIEVTLPSGGAAETAWPAGLYTVSVSLVRPGDPDPQESNVAAMLLAPEAILPPTTVTRNATTRRVKVTLDVRPRVRPAQDVRLTLGGHTAVADPHPATTDSLTFAFDAVPPGAQWVRLTVDGVESLLVDRSVDPPVFDPGQSIVVPA
jgi:hypothetical protein